MANRAAARITAILAGKPRTLCLTLGALAELEDAFGADDLAALAARFSTGRLSSRDLIRILAAGLKGGRDPSDTEAPPDAASLGRDEDVATLAAVVADLLQVTFGVAGEGTTRAPTAGDRTARHDAHADGLGASREDAEPIPEPAPTRPPPPSRPSPGDP